MSAVLVRLPTAATAEAHDTVDHLRARVLPWRRRHRPVDWQFWTWSW